MLLLNRDRIRLTKKEAIVLYAVCRAKICHPNGGKIIGSICFIGITDPKHETATIVKYTASEQRVDKTDFMGIRTGLSIFQLEEVARGNGLIYRLEIQSLFKCESLELAEEVLDLMTGTERIVVPG